LKGLGESTAKSDRKRDTVAQSLAAHKSAFDAAARTLRTARSFAEKVPAQVDASELQSVSDSIACLESYVVNTAPTCEPVKSVLQAYLLK
jgi:hypothetical protein